MTDYQRVIAEIDLDALAYNMRQIREKAEKTSQIMAIIKADAYGHGAVEVAKVLLYNGCDCFGVAMVDEGVQLRKNNIFVPVLILGYTPQLKIDEVVKYDLMQTVFSFDTAKELSTAAKKYNKIAKIHIKIDTGMGRIGFLPEEAIEEIKRISTLPNIEINGIYTHFSAADETEKDFTFQQYDCFMNIVEKLEKDGISIANKHASNSAALVDLGALKLNMTRPGIILYGIYPSDEVHKKNIALKPVMSIKTRVSHVKAVPRGTPIGYGRAYYTDKESVIATVPVGYADGYLRKMANGGRVIIAGEYAPIVGRICMDQFMVDISHIKAKVCQGDEVVLMGHFGECEITADELATLLDTISYEVVCMIGKRVPRQYFKNNTLLKTVNYVY